MRDESSSMKLEEFELVEAAPGTALLRITARTSLRRAERSLRLMVDDGRERHHLTPLPAPPDPAGLLRVAFSSPSALLSGARFALELPDGSTYGLPAPRRRGRIATRETASLPPQRELEELDQQLAALRTQAEEHSASAAAQRAELEALRTTAGEMAAQLDEAERAVHELEGQLTTRDRQQQSEHDEALAGLTEANERLRAEANTNEAARENVVRQLSVTEAAWARSEAALERLRGAEAARAETEAELHDLRRQLTEREQSHAELVTRLGDADVRIGQLNDQIAARETAADERSERGASAREPAEAEFQQLQERNVQLAARADELAARLAEARERTQTLERDGADAERRRTEHALSETSQLPLRYSREVEAAQLRALELSAAERARTYALAEIAAAGSPLIVGSAPRGPGLSVEAVTGVILVALGIIVAALILTGAIHT